METTKKSLKHRLQNREATSWHIGGLIALYNTLIILAVTFLALLSVDFFAFWVFLLIVTPVFLAGFWFWITQRLLVWYDHFSFHETVVIAKLSVFPFFVLFIICAVSIVSIWESTAVLPAWKVMAYEGLLFSLGCLLVGMTVMVFGLRHRIRISVPRA